MKSANKCIKSALTAAVIGAIVSLILAVIKTAVGLNTNSVCIMLDGANSYLDIVSGITAAVAFGFLLKPKTHNAPFGYGKGEYLAGFITTVICLIFGIVFLLESVNRLAMPQPVWFGLESTLLLVAAFVIKLGLAAFYCLINKKIKFKALAALFLDSLLDLGITSASIVSLTVSSRISFAADAYFGIAISLIVIIFAIIGSRSNLKSLLGVNAEIYAEQLSEISHICSEHGVEMLAVSLHDYGCSGVYGTLDAKLIKQTEQQPEQIISLVNEALSAQNYHLRIITQTKVSASIPSDDKPLL